MWPKGKPNPHGTGEFSLGETQQEVLRILRLTSPLTAHQIANHLCPCVKDKIFKGRNYCGKIGDRISDSCRKLEARGLVAGQRALSEDGGYAPTKWSAAAAAPLISKKDIKQPPVPTRLSG